MTLEVDLTEKDVEVLERGGFFTLILPSGIKVVVIKDDDSQNKHSI